jgi:hypothetical protein
MMVTFLLPKEAITIYNLALRHAAERECQMVRHLSGRILFENMESSQRVRLLYDLTNGTYLHFQHCF